MEGEAAGVSFAPQNRACLKIKPIKKKKTKGKKAKIWKRTVLIYCQAGSELYPWIFHSCEPTQSL